MTSSARLLDVDRCLLRDSALLTLVRPDAAGYLYKRSNLSGWYRYWFSLSGSQLLYFERTRSARRGLLVGTISLFRHKLSIVNSLKRRREFEITDAGGKVHVLRAGSDAEMHWWVQLFTISRNKIPPAKPIAPAVPPAMSHTNNALQPLFTFVDPHLKVDHVLCIVHGIGVSPQLLASNIKHLQESYADVMEKVFPDLQFRVEMLPVHWRVALTKLDIHQKLHAVVPSTPVPDDANPLRQFMVHRIVDYVYYTHPRYRRHILREVCSQLNAQIDAFRMRRPDFNGTISVMGHSLGAALCYELMCRKVYDDQALLESERMRLNFDAANLFCLGNPLGTFLALDPSIGLNANMHHLPFRLFNIYKFHDPIATRLEPLSDISNMHRPPVVVPCWFNMGLRETTSQWLGGLWPRQSKASQPESEHAKPPTASASPKSGSDDNPDHSENDSRRGLSPSPSRPALSIDCPASYSQRASAGELELRQRSSDVFSDVQGQHDGTPDDYNGLRLDYALQMSSTIEEVSTSWSALKAHTDYWENRDAMLFMVSRMLKSAFAIGDDVDDRAAISLSDRIIDEDILMKIPNGEFAQTPKWGRQKSQGVLLEDTVRQVVERIVDEAVAAHELMKLHPNVRMRGGGIAGRSPAVSKTDMGKGAGDSGSGDQSRGGWAAYLRGGWFGSDSSSKK
ncbi:Phospholipase DDHD1 [Gracilariopsis chorda]|uniref:Phospholipase DDHD1 n=1 Tax=Gracilariopsis chorda TaxID=448386 RepID=A0A2V3IYI1_9FLOR|nr:Phospholipase DDHD1 [Gracilariopsis chorda]|eukprot:PXF47208.1 Phospholipase DDHD1 [Gracilariopsis chorda]